MHAHGVIHRDVKTENFCLGGGCDNENIYAIDYGFARPAFGEHSLSMVTAVVKLDNWQHGALQNVMTSPTTQDALRGSFRWQVLSDS